MKVTIFGSNGLLGSEVVNEKPIDSDLFCPSSREIDLENDQIDSKKNDVWINCAAKVGGVKGNTDLVADFFLINSRICNNVFAEAHTKKVGKLVSILSTCIYPDKDYVRYPLTEDQLHNGPPHQSNFGYAYAKRMLDVGSRAYRSQHGDNFISLIPNNLYGPRDNYDINHGHVIPSLIRKFFEAKQSQTDVVIWGDGSPLREFTYAADIAKIVWWAVDHYSGAEPLNIGNTEEISIGDLASLIGRIIGFKNHIKFDKTKPNGQHRKPSSNAKLLSLGCNIKYTSLEEGLSKTIEHFVGCYPNVRGIM